MRALTATFWTVAVLVAAPPSASLDLSSKNLSYVPPDLPPSVDVLDLSCNRIHILHRQDFELTTHLRFLNMSWNGLAEISPETFCPTPSIEDLDLSHNRLQNLSDQLYLQHTRNLRVLDLTFNRFHTMALGKEFGSPLKMKKLGLGAEQIRTGDFGSIANMTLQVLTLRLENLTSYEEGSLAHIRAEKVRIALTNRPADESLIADALLMFAEVELMGLRGGHGNLAKLLKQRGAVNTSHLYLTDIQITWDQLTDAINAVFLSPIAHLTTSDTAISNPPYNDSLVIRTSHTRSFSARRARVMTFFFSQEALYNFFINMPVESLAILETSIIHMTCPKASSKIRQLDFSECALTETVFSRVEGQETVECRNLDELDTLVLRDNNLKSLQLLSKRVQHMGSLHHLDLSVNSLRYDSLEDCLWSPAITSLNLSFNGLNQDVFHCLPNRTVTLDLQNNQIFTIPDSVLKLEFLSVLDLSANRLRDLPVCFGFPNLKVLLLRENSLHAPTVDEYHLNSCPLLETLDASRNPFICTCALRCFRELGVHGSSQGGGGSRHTGIKLVHWPQGYYCTYPEPLRNKTLKDFWVPEISCNVGFLAAAILCPAVVLMVGVVILCRRLDAPWYLGMIWQWARAKHRARTQQVQPEDLEGVEFHAFVSYSQHDADWVKGQLLPILEDPSSSLRICHHERDFIPGRTIVENILRCVEKSRRCVFVLSAHFVRSEWCHYELYFASHQRLARGSDTVVLVLLEPLPQYMIPSKYYQLKAMMDRHTYLEWPQDRAKHRLFWANLKAALQEDLPNTPVRNMEER